MNRSTIGLAVSCRRPAMRLKKLTLHGFKTFADRTEITFAPGVTAIVGPNGSGKSNLLDSLLWVLGEQKTSALRAAKASDVIFAGSGKRKAMGMAEVSLTVDNEDRFLPLDFAEVTVTRRAYRNGESEYLLNKTPCRLKDITDLFLDTGVGRGAYAIVNQSEVDAILSARAEDRRELFEEAAGIKKYRVKKREATRKLDATEANLLRIHDIASEVDANLSPLAAQARAARRFAELSERLREIEVAQLAADYHRLATEIAVLTAQATAADADAAGSRESAAENEARITEMGAAIADAEGQMDAARTAQQAAMTRTERAEGQIALSAERKSSAQKTVASVEADVETLKRDAERFEAEGEGLGIAAKNAEAAANETGQQLAVAEAASGEASRALAELSRTAAGADAEYLALARKLATQKSEWESVRGRIAAREAEVLEADARAVSRESEADTARTLAESLAGQTQTAQAILTEARRVLAEEREPARVAATSAVQTAGDARQSKERRLTETAARLRVLEETEAALEGYYVGVKSVTKAAQSGKLGGRYDLVADVLRVPSDLDTAIEIALGGSLQDVITDTEAEAKAAIRFLNETRGGRATFLPLDALRPPDVPDALRRAAKQYAGVLGSAADLVGYDADVAPAIRVLLARVLIVDDLDTATKVSRSLTREFGKIVTLGGEVVVPSGAITGGASGRPGVSLLGRKREVTELTESVTISRAEVERLKVAEAEARQAENTARQAVREAESAVSAARDHAADTERKWQSAKADADRAERDATTLAARAKQLAESVASDREREANLRAAVEGAESADTGAQSVREEITKRQAVLSVRRDEAQVQVRTLGAELAARKERARAASRDAQRVRENALRAGVSAEERTRRADEARTAIERENAGTALRVRERDAARESLAEATAGLEKWRGVRQTLLSENFALTDVLKAANAKASEAVAAANAARTKSARTEAQAEQIAERLIAEYELLPEDAVAQTGGVPVERDVAAEIARLRREIKALGAVNTGAIEEYDRLSERSRFLAEQRADLSGAKERLLAAIAEIDESTRGVFEETFAAVGVAFGRLFARLFGGGTTQLVLTNPGDLLETGIDIYAEPPGKKRQSLALLSGGERALTATALLFAFLEVRPAPFCVLDEVDAPLDGANVEKFAELLRDFGQGSQFIVITHNATTMEAAPLWFGITMQEPGVSRGISLQVPPQTGAERFEGEGAAIQ
ncbi:MAG: chromosome segregation protein SMC [Armatimonadetes bacterium]|nr:chromosome segregation protein SMC [Armatimonadota bacterium]